MEATRDDIEGLFELQRIDLEIKRLSKELDELPQRGIIVVARDKKTAIEAKSEQVAELKRATTKKITRIDDEDASLAKKEAGVQAAIDAGVTGVMPSYSRPATDARSQPQTRGTASLIAAGGARPAPITPPSSQTLPEGHHGLCTALSTPTPGLSPRGLTTALRI